MTTTARIYPVLQAFEQSLTKIVFTINQLARGLSDMIPINFSLSETATTPVGGADFYNQIIVTDGASRGASATDVAFDVEENVILNGWGGNKAAGRFITQQTGTVGSVPPSIGLGLTGIFGISYTSKGQGGTPGTEKGTYFGSSFTANLDAGATNVWAIVGGENDISTVVGSSYKYGMGYSSVAMNVVAASTWDAAYEIGSGSSAGAPQAWKYGILATDIHGSLPFRATATFVGLLSPTLGTQTMTTGIDMRTNLAFTGNAFQSLNFQVEGTGKVTSLVGSGAPAFVSAAGAFTADGDGFVTTAGLFASQVINTGRMSSHVPRTISGAGATSDSPTSSDYSIIANVTGVLTLTLPAVGGANSGRWLYIKTITANTVVSASSNVVPRTTATAGTAILAAAAGNWAAMQSDGTNWIIMAGS